MSGVLKLLTNNPDVAFQTLQSSNLANQSAGDYLVKAFITNSGVPGIATPIPAGSTLTFTVHMRKTASAGTMYPRLAVGRWQD